MMRGNFTVYPKNTQLSEEDLYYVFVYPPDVLIEAAEGTVDVTLSRIDSVLAEPINEHVKKIFENGYADRLNAFDFFHGHMVVNANTVSKKVEVLRVKDGKLKPQKERHLYADFPETVDIKTFNPLFQNSDPHFIYHTREHIGIRNPYKGTPRSIIGTFDGNVYPMSSNEDSYFSHGGVSEDDLFEFNGRRHNAMGTIRSNIRIKLDGQEFYVSPSQFYILKDGNGRFQLTSGQRFDSYYLLMKPRDNE